MISTMAEIAVVNNKKIRYAFSGIIFTIYIPKNAPIAMNGNNVRSNIKVSI
jgi:hypothetical protein